jgi:hypothetical protein
MHQTDQSRQQPAGSCPRAPLLLRRCARLPHRARLRRGNARLDTLNRRGFPPIAKVVSGMDVVDALYAAYGDGPPRGSGPVQDSIRAQWSEYLHRAFPRIDFIRRARVVRVWR